MILINNETNNLFNFGYIGWKSYNTIKKKAMEQEFSWSGLIISLSIAFFVIIAASQISNIAYQSYISTKNKNLIKNEKIYQLERGQYINPVSKEKIEYLKTNKTIADFIC